MRTAVVTGASRGIGRAIAERLAADGLAVAVGAARAGSGAVEVVAAIQARGGDALAVHGDLTEPGAATALFDAATARFGGVDVVVHSAGVMHPPTPIADVDLELLARVHEVNVIGTFAVLREASRRVRDGGAIVTLSSTALATSLPGYAPYVSSKAALDSITLILARELRGRDITVNAVAPGPTATELFVAGKSDETIAAFARAPPLERLGAPADIAEVVSFLAGPGRWVNGQSLRANGGLA